MIGAFITASRNLREELLMTLPYLIGHCRLLVNGFDAGKIFSEPIIITKRKILQGGIKNEELLEGIQCLLRQQPAAEICSSCWLTHHCSRHFHQ